jgi:hypothetical protein
VGPRLSVAAGFLQATTLSFVLVATQIGQQVHLLSAATGAALIAAAVLPVLVYPLVALSLRRDGAAAAPASAL